MADNSNRVAGTAFFSVDGVSYAIIGDWSYRVSGAKRETVRGLDGIHGYKETPSEGQIKGKIRDGQSVSLTALNGMTNVTLTLELANGKTVIGRNMWQVGDEGAPSVAVDDAEIDVTFEGRDVQD